MHLAGDRVEAMLANDGQLHAGLLLHAQHLLNRRATDLHRFLDDHMPPWAHDLASMFPMQTAGCADVDDIEFLVSQHLLKIPVSRHVKFLCSLMCYFGGDVS